MRTIKVPQSSSGERRNLFINNLKGVDYASSPLDVAQNRAVEMSNLHLDDGILHKRNGARQIDFDQESIVDAVSVWGMRAYYVDNGRELRFVKNNEIIKRFSLADGEVYNLKVYNDRLYAFTTNGVYEYAYEKVSDNTSMEIVEKSSRDNPYISVIAIGGGVDTYGSSFDEVNLSQPIVVDKRQNYITAKEKDISWAEVATDIIDEKYITKYTGTLDINCVTFPLIGKYAYSNNEFWFPPYYKLASKNVELTFRISGGKIKDGKPYSLTAYSLEENASIEIENAGYFVKDVDGKCYVLITKDFVTTLYSTKIRQDAYDGQVSEIQKAYFVGMYCLESATVQLMDKLKQARVSAIFGSEANENRLFIANGNYVFYSDVNNFAYFPEGNVIRCGAEGSPITAMCKISDGTLAVTKKDYSGDKSIYYISYALQTETISNTEIAIERFTAKAGATGFGAVNDKCFVNFADDYVFLTDKGLYAIVSKSNISTDLRYMRERSRTINPKLLRTDLSNACCYVYNNKLFISDGERTYLADARYKYSVDADMDDTFNYEWFVWNIGAKTFFEIDDKLAYIGTTDGKAYYFDDGFSDSEAIVVPEGSVGNLDGSLDYEEVSIDGDLWDKISPVDIYRTSGFAYEIIEKRQEGEACYVTLHKIDNYGYGNDGYFEHFKPVISFWYSPYFDLGANYYLKTLKAIGVGLEPLIESELKFSYKTASEVMSGGVAMYDALTDGGSIIDFDDFDFGDITFNINTFAKNNVWRVHKRGVNYVSFEFWSNTAKDCAVNNVMFEYLIVKRLRGGR